MKKFDEIREFVNSISEDKIDKNTIYLIESEIGERKSYIINDIEIVNGKIDYSKNLKNGTVWMKTIIREIQALEKAKSMVIELIKK